MIKTFLSKNILRSLAYSFYYYPPLNIEKYFKQFSLDFKILDSTFRLRQCPHCNSMNHSLIVDKQSGNYHCSSCNQSGMFHQLKGKLLGIQQNQNSDKIDIEVVQESHYLKYLQNMQKHIEAQEYMKQRGIKKQIYEKYKLGINNQIFLDIKGDRKFILSLIFPMFRPIRQNQFCQASKINSNNAILVKYKVRGIGKQNKGYMRQRPTGAMLGLFGLNTIQKFQGEQLIITQGQIDAMTVNQVTGIPAVSLPIGAGHLPIYMIPWLDKLKKIYLWMDNDEVGRLNTQKIATKLGIKRTYIVKMSQQKGIKDANDLLMQQKTQKIKQYIATAKTIPGSNIIQFIDIKSSLLQRLTNYQQHIGIKSQYFSFFNKKVKGLRMGELTIISGGTGCGKTTLLAQMSLDFCKNGIRTLWGSFQIKNQVLLTTMLFQFSQINLLKNQQKYEYFSEQYSNLPIHYLSFFGSTDLQKVIGTIQYAIEVSLYYQKYDINHVVIDTLQFLLAGQASGFQKFQLMDYAITKLRCLATQSNIHVTVVIHPRKVDQNQDLGIHTIFGTSKSTQQADNVWIIQKRQNYKIFDIKKNRFDGEVGKAAFGFNKETKSFFQLTRKQLQKLHKKQMTIQQVLQNRSKGMAQYNEAQQAILGQSLQYVIQQDMLSRKKKLKKHVQ